MDYEESALKKLKLGITVFFFFEKKKNIEKWQEILKVEISEVRESMLCSTNIFPFSSWETGARSQVKVKFAKVSL